MADTSCNDERRSVEEHGQENNTMQKPPEEEKSMPVDSVAEKLAKWCRMKPLEKPFIILNSHPNLVAKLTKKSSWQTISNESEQS